MPTIRSFLSVDDMIHRFDGIEYTRNDNLGYVYICEYGKDLKIGCTTQPKTRLKTHESNARIYGNKKIGMISITSIGFPFYRDFEYVLHWIYANERKTENGELFALKHNAVIPIFVTEFASFLRFIKDKEHIFRRTGSVYYDYIQFLGGVNA